MKRDLYAEVSARILADLERGAAPWVKPWSATPGMNTPANAITGRPYSGCNVVLLWLSRNHGWATPRFLTFKQALEAGGNVRKGEHGTKVYFVKQVQLRDEAEPSKTEGPTRVIPMLREYTVFNVAQCESLPNRITAPQRRPVRNKDHRDSIADAFIASSGADIREGAGEAYFAPGVDFISLPAFAAFKSAHNFYARAFHELGHWTGHRSRLDRQNSANALAIRPMQRRNWLRNCAPPSYVPNSILMAICGTPVTSPTGLRCSSRMHAHFSRPPARRKPLSIFCAESLCRATPRWPPKTGGARIGVRAPAAIRLARACEGTQERKTATRHNTVGRSNGQPSRNIRQPNGPVGF